MCDLISSVLNSPSLREADLLERCNHFSAPFGLALSETAMARLSRRRTDILRETGRVEFGESVLGKLIFAFASSPWISQPQYEETLLELQELFYTFKNECHDLLTDDELIGAMCLIFDDAAGGSLDYLSGVEWQTMYRIAVTGRLAGTGLPGFDEGG